MNFISLLDNIKKYDVNLYDEIKYKFIYKPKNRDELKEAVDIYCHTESKGIKIFGNIALWDVSNITKMTKMFHYRVLHGDISNWDTQNVINMSYMFRDSPFNGDISIWDVSNVIKKVFMFDNSYFKGDISQWDVSSLTNK